MPRPDRSKRVAEMQKQQQAAERRHNLIIWSAAGVVLALIVGAVAWAAISNRPVTLEGVQSYDNLSQDHVTERVDYPQSPPVGGAHHAAWWNCGVYDQAIPTHHAVHSLEHGAVWLTYRPGLPADQLETLRKLAGDEFMMLSPVEDQPAPVMATAWGHQLSVDSASDPQVTSFIREYRQGPQTPEPGAACTGGTTVDLLTTPTPTPAPSMDSPRQSSASS